MKRSLVILGAVMLVLGMSGVAKAADEVPAGKKLFLDNKCNSCHTIASQGVEKKAAAEAAEAKEGKAAEATEEASATKKKVPDLGGVGIERKADWMTKYLQKVEAINGKKHIKKFKGTDAELLTMATWLESLKDETAGKAMMEKEKTEGGDKAVTETKPEGGDKAATETKTEGTEKKVEGETK